MSFFGRSGVPAPLPETWSDKVFDSFLRTVSGNEGMAAESAGREHASGPSDDTTIAEIGVNL